MVLLVKRGFISWIKIISRGLGRGYGGCFIHEEDLEGGEGSAERGAILECEESFGIGDLRPFAIPLDKIVKDP